MNMISAFLKIPNDDNKILKYISEKKSLKVPFIIYADLECLLQKINACLNIPEKSYTEKKAVHKASGYSLITYCSFDKSENEREYYRGKDCMKMFFNDLKEQVNKIINYEMKTMTPLTNEEKESYENQEIFHICEKEFCTDKDKKEFKLKKKVRDRFHYTGKYRGAAHSICMLRCKITKKIPVVFHNGSTYDYYFIIKELAREFKGYFHCLGENTEKFITFSVPNKKEVNDGVKICDNGIGITLEQNKKIVTYRLKFIDSYRFMQGSLSSLADNLSEVNNKNLEMSYDTLIKKFHNTYQLCDNDFDQFNLLLRKGVYPHEYMDKWEKFNEDKLPDKELFSSELNKEHITTEDYAHAQKVWDPFNIKNLGEYHHLYVQSDTTLLADVFENFSDKCIEIYRLDPAHFLTAPGLAWQACLKKTEVELELLTDNDMLILFEKGIRGGMCQATYIHAKANNKCVKNYDKNKESSYLEYVDANNLYRWAGNVTKAPCR